MNSYRIAVIPGDGIGTEVIPVGVKVLEAIAEVHDGFRFRFDAITWKLGGYQNTEMQIERLRDRSA